MYAKVNNDKTEGSKERISKHLCNLRTYSPTRTENINEAQ